MLSKTFPKVDYFGIGRQKNKGQGCQYFLKELLFFKSSKISRIKIMGFSANVKRLGSSERITLEKLTFSDFGSKVY